MSNRLLGTEPLAPCKWAAAVAKTSRTWEIDQVRMLPPTTRELAPEDHVAHFVRVTVREDLDLSLIFAR